MYPFSVIDPDTLMLKAVGVFSVTGLFMALAHGIRKERAYAWLAAGNPSFAIGAGDAALLANADTALFEAKRSGGNCVYPPPNVGAADASGGDDAARNAGGSDLGLASAMLEPGGRSGER